MLRLCFFVCLSRSLRSCMTFKRNTHRRNKGNHTGRAASLHRLTLFSVLGLWFAGLSPPGPSSARACPRDGVCVCASARVLQLLAAQSEQIVFAPGAHTRVVCRCWCRGWCVCFHDSRKRESEGRSVTSQSAAPAVAGRDTRTTRKETETRTLVASSNEAHSMRRMLLHPPPRPVFSLLRASRVPAKARRCLFDVACCCCSCVASQRCVVAEGRWRADTKQITHT